LSQVIPKIAKSLDSNKCEVIGKSYYLNHTIGSLYHEDKKSQAIVKYREQNGHFKSIDDLRNVKGIGDKIIENNKNNLKLKKSKGKTKSKEKKTKK